VAPLNQEMQDLESVAAGAAMAATEAAASGAVVDSVAETVAAMEEAVAVVDLVGAIKWEEEASEGMTEETGHTECCTDEQHSSPGIHHGGRTYWRERWIRHSDHLRSHSSATQLLLFSPARERRMCSVLYVGLWG